MKNYHLISFLFLLTIMSCAAKIEDTSEDIIKSSIGGEGYGPYPLIDSKESKHEENENYWDCGSEWIVVEGPDGKLINKEIPLQCDPHADFYVGCPTEINLIQK